MLLPKQVGFTFTEQLVMSVISWVCRVEWWVTSIQDENDDTQREKIDCITLVRLLLDKLGGHVCCGSKVCLEETRAVAALHWRSKAKIGESNVVLAVEHDVFGLQIAMGDTVNMHVMHHLQHLLEVIAADWCTEMLKSDVIK